MSNFRINAPNLTQGYVTSPTDAPMNNPGPGQFNVFFKTDKQLWYADEDGAQTQLTGTGGGGSVPSTREVNTAGDIQGGGDLSINRTHTLTTTGVTAGSYTYASFTVSATGRITAAASGATPALASYQVIAGTGLTGGGALSGSVTLNIANTGVTAATYTYATVAVNAQGQITSASNGATPALASYSVIAGTGLTGGGALSGSVTLNLANTAVSAGSYTATNLTVDAQGRITAAASYTATPGSILFADASTGEITQANSNLFYDASTGNVGIGTNVPARRLSVHTSTTDTRLQITNSTTTPANNRGLVFGITNNVAFLGNNEASGYIGMYTALTERWKYQSNGDFTTSNSTPGALFGVGTETPNYQIQVHNPSSGNTRIQVTNATTGSGSVAGMNMGTIGTYGFIANNHNDTLALYTNLTERVRLLGDGNLELDGGGSKSFRWFNTGGFYTGMKASNSQGSNVSYTLPTAYPTSTGYVLAADTSGVMSWVAQSGGGSGDLLATVTGIDLTSVGDTTLYTVPGGKTVYIKAIIVVLTSVSGFTSVGSVSAGRNASAYDDILGDQALTGLSTTSSYILMAVSGAAAVAAATEDIKLSVNNAYSASTAVATVIVLGTEV